MWNLLKIIRWLTLWTIFFVMISGGLIIAGVYLHITEDLPEISSLRDYRPPVVTTVYSDDNRKIAEFYKERRIVIPLSIMPKLLVQAFLAAE
ncbi:MAG: penicillin-binding protein, partial [Deltaproteobacteria bacterium]